ncbi:DUF624 domain-containing protein [Microbacterium sp.]|uniref:DUF624 domain-containing protein n=1 Tax=Microbacterium sp. TaxID=51671 RepID=UPI0039E2DEA7
MKIDPESRALQGMSSFLAFVALNVIYLAACLPVVTIPAATSALYEVTMRYSDDESGHPVKDFFPAFGRNAGRATLLGLCLAVPMLLLGASAVFWAAHPSVLAAAAAVIATIAAVYLFAAFLFAMALTAAYTTAFRQALKNALLLPAAEPVRTFGILLIPVALVCITIVLPMFGVILATIGFSIAAYATAFLFRSVFARRS